MSRLIKGVNDLETYCKAHPEVAHLLEEWDYEKNEGLTPRDVSKLANKKVWWVGKCGHSWHSIVGGRVYRNQSCPYCSGRYPIVGETDLQTTHPDIAKEWDYVKNYPLTPQMVKAGTNKKVWWLGECKHSWDAGINPRARGEGCPYCSHQRFKSGINDLQTELPSLAKEWNYEKNFPLTPSDVLAGGLKKYWWNCENNHTYYANVHNRKYGFNCPYCARNIVCKGENDLLSQYPDIAKEWDYERNYPQTPNNIACGSVKKYWWLCEKGHNWYAQVNNRVYEHTGCPRCTQYLKTSFPEKSFAYYLKSHQIVENYKIKGTKMEADIYVPDFNLAIEYDGHAWHSDAKAVNRDMRKNSILAKRGIRLIRVREEGCPTLLGDFIEYKVSPDQSDLGDVVKRVLSEQFGIEADVDIERDRAEIMKLVKGE